MKSTLLQLPTLVTMASFPMLYALISYKLVHSRFTLYSELVSYQTGKDTKPIGEWKKNWKPCKQNWKQIINKYMSHLCELDSYGTTLRKMKNSKLLVSIEMKNNKLLVSIENPVNKNENR